jgi:hypothetical protein
MWIADPLCAGVIGSALDGTAEITRPPRRGGPYTALVKIDPNRPQKKCCLDRIGLMSIAGTLSQAENRFGAATQAYRSALPELRLTSLHRSSAFQGDRQRLPMRFQKVRPIPSTDPSIDLWR